MSLHGDFTAPIVVDAIGHQTATIAFLHGGGENGHDYVDAVNHWQSICHLGHVKFILPHAPFAQKDNEDKRNWFHLNSLPSVDPEDPCQEQILPSVLQSQGYLHSLIRDEIARGIPSQRIILAGFSQGGAISVFAGITADDKLAGIVGLSTWLLFGLKAGEHVPKEDANRSTPIVLCHKIEDHVIRHRLAQDSVHLLNDMGYEATLKHYNGKTHSMSNEELDVVGSFFAARLPPVGSDSEVDSAYV